MPQSGNGGIGVALISYCDQVTLSVQSDECQLKTISPAGKPVRPLEDAFYDEIQRLKALAIEEAASDALRKGGESKKRQ